MTGIKLPPHLVEFNEKVAAWQLAACTWLGLDPEAVIKINEHDIGVPGWPALMVEWASDLEPTGPNRGERGPWNVQSDSFGDSGSLLWRASIVLRTRDDAEGFKAEVGPEPKLFTELEEARIRSALAGDARPERRGWFSDVDQDNGGRWQPCLETGTGHIPSFEVWFDTEAECDQWIRDNVIGVGKLP